MKNIVLDSSVIIKWFKSHKEEKTEEAAQILSDYLKGKITVYISHLTILELLNNAVFDVLIPQDRWLLNIRKFFELRLKIILPNEVLAKEIYKIGGFYNISAYDASYIALAQSLEADFITADVKLVKKVKLPFVKAL
jgi:predicted nucleic acid-binding protein